LVAARLRDAGNLMEDHQFQAARSLVQIAKEMDAGNPAVYLAEVEIDVWEAISLGEVPPDLLARAEHAAADVPTSVAFKSNLGILYLFGGNTKKALASSESAVRIAHKIGTPALIAKAEHNLGVISTDAGNPEGALPHLVVASRILCSKPESSDLCADSLYAIARVHFQKKDYSTSLEHLSRAKQHAKELKPELDLLSGESHMAVGNLASAQGEVEQARAVFHASRNLRGESYSTLVLAQIRGRQGKCRDATRLLMEATELAKKTGIQMTLVQSLGFGSEIQEGCKDLHESYVLSVMALMAVKASGNATLTQYQEKRTGELAARLKPAELPPLDRAAHLRSLELGLPVSPSP
jgi:tetratricopeptide (TPR) repeat protein